MNKKVVIYLRVIFSFLWILLSAFIWTIFLFEFLEVKTFSMWMPWGFACMLLNLPSAIRFIWSCAREGYVEGKHSYSGTLFGSVYGGIGVSIHDHRYFQAIVTLIMGMVAFVIAGPILLAIQIVLSICKLVGLIRILCTDKSFTLKALKITGIVVLVLLLVWLVCIVFDSCTSINRNYVIYEQETGSGYQLDVRRSSNHSSLNYDEYVWSLSDEKVAHITAGGELVFDKGGYVVVRATSVKNKNDYVEKEFFVPYDVVSASAPVVSTLNTFDQEQFFLDLANVVATDAYHILCATRQDKLFDVLDELLAILVTFDDDDAYLFSSAIGKYSVDNEVLYVLSDFSNSDVNVSSKNIMEDELANVLCQYGEEGLGNGASIQNFGVNLINAFLEKEIPADGVYRFSKMDNKYEYRVVVKGDFNYGIASHYYRHGLLTGLKDFLKDVKNRDWDSIRDNWFETKYTHEIDGVYNLRICIEYREKTI